MTDTPLTVAVLGAGRWAQFAHVPGWQRDPRCTVETICDVEAEKAETAADEFSIPTATDDWEAAIADPEVDVVDVATPSDTHHELATAALEAGKHVLCEKPVAHDYRDTRRAAKLARENGLKTKLGFTFRYSPGVQFAKSLIDDGFIGRPFYFNGYEQNSQWLDPRNPLRQEDPETGGEIQTAALEGYGAPIIDIGHWWVGADLDRVVGTMTNFIEERVHRDRQEEGPIPINIDDADVFIGEFDNGTLSTFQHSFVTVGSYPGLEARIYGERGAIICRLIQEGDGPAERMWTAQPDPDAVDKAADVEFVEREIPEAFYPAGGEPAESWRTLFYANLIGDFVDEISGEVDRNQGNFDDGAWVQEAINAMETAAREDRWVNFPLES